MNQNNRDVYYPQLNLLRGLAALMVVVYHLTNHWDSVKGYFLPENDPLRRIGHYGHLGVFVFFVISGFVIPLSLYKGRYTVRSFFRFMFKRLVRLEPPYLVSICLILALSLFYHFTHGKPWAYDTERTFSHLLYLTPFTGHEWYNPIYWTLALEFQFYILMALLFPLLDHAQKWIRYSAFAAFCGSAYFFFDERFAVHYAPLFGMGIICFWYLTDRAGKWELYLGAIGMLIFAWLRLDMLIMLSMIPTVIFILYVRHDKPLSNRFGDISYSLYLTHGTVGGHILALSAIGITALWLKYTMIAISIFVCLVFAYYFWKWIEKPAITMSRKIKL